MTLEDLESTFDAYIEEASRLKEVYSDQIELIVGLETECITQESLDHLQKLLRKHEQVISYIVGSVHHVNGIPIDFDKPTFERALNSFEEGKDGLSQLDQLFCAYFDAQYELLRLCQPEVIGHIDLCRLYLPGASFEAPAVWSRIERNVDYAVKYGALFEVNAAAFRKGWSTAYPGKDVLEVCSQVLEAFGYVADASCRLQLILSKNGLLTLSDDSHGPHAVALHYKDAHRYLLDLGVEDLYYLTASQIDPHERVESHKTALGDRHSARLNVKVAKFEKGWQNYAFWQHLP